MSSGFLVVVKMAEVNILRQGIYELKNAICTIDKCINKFEWCGC
ncbi:unnamed protein product [marine sediment metagenome]|uniref:Uncharacterized protein n=1 Tax=marine sediment metagenome TaxID=412755 RepID=X1DTF8_9ZZZZ